MRHCSPARFKTRRQGFTLVEALVAVAVLLLIFTALLQFCDNIDRAWRSGATDPFAEAQQAFEIVAADLAAATLEPYQDYADAAGAFRNDATFVPDHLAARSDLAWVCGPASGGLLSRSGRTTFGSAVFLVTSRGLARINTGAGLPLLLNADGYFVDFGTDDGVAAFFTFAHRARYRLRQVRQPTESLSVYAPGTAANWVKSLVPPGSTVPALAENILALVVLPERHAGDPGAPLAPTYAYDSRDATSPATVNQLPPRVRFALVAIDAPSAERLAQQYGNSPPALLSAALFQQADQLDADLAALDVSLTQRKIGHRIFQREVQMTGWRWIAQTSP